MPLRIAGKNLTANKEYPNRLFAMNAIKPDNGGSVAYPKSRCLQKEK
jgi:hypothetical protein